MMTVSLFKKLSIAAAATATAAMLTLTPAMAGKRDHSHGYYGNSGYNHYLKRKHAKRHWGHHHHAGKRFWKPRFYGYGYGYNGYKPRRHWR